MTKILVVEDNPMIQEILVERLQMRQFAIVTANNGQEGVEAAQQQSPDLILMDVSLPQIDGWEATRLLRGLEATRHIPIIALTAHALIEDREKSLVAGCNDFETKPIDFPSLLIKINRLLNHKM
ncbi:MAG: response regulator [Anaerolineae bacterium]|nr:response regulator [Anaerolineae bacterium]